MSALHGIWYRLRTLFRPRAADAERDAEFRFHLSLDAMHEREAGAGPRTAEWAARRRFGNVTAYGEEIRSRGAGGAVGRLGQRIRYVIRYLARSPGFAAAAVLTLALGIGGVAAIGTVVYAVLLKPLPYPDPSRLAAVWLHFGIRDLETAEHSDAGYFVFRRFARATRSIGAYRLQDVNLGALGEPERVSAAAVTADFFSVLGVPPLAGRVFGPVEDRPGAAPVALMGESLWRRRFGADPSVVGKRIVLDGRSHQVIGILPDVLAFPSSGIGFWIPLALDPDQVVPASNNYRVIARLAPGASLETARLDLQHALDRMAEVYPDAGFGFSTRKYLEIAQPRVLVHPLKDEVVGDAGEVLWVLFGTAGFVLLVAGANVATLFLVRAESRRREAAVRIALGAGPGGLIGHFMAEGLVLAIAGAGLAVGLTVGAIGILGRIGGVRIPRLDEVGVDPISLGAVLVLAVVIGLLCSAAPIVRLRRLEVAPALRSGGRGATGGARQRARQVLVVGQIALAFALLAGCGLLAKTYRELRQVRPGFDPTGVLAFRTALPAADYPGMPDVARFHRLMEERLAMLPGRPVVGAVSKLPLRPGGESQNTAWVEDRPDFDLARSAADVAFTSGDYFGAMKIPVLAGRPTGPLDPSVASEEAAVDLAFARNFWDDSTGREAIGRRIRLTPTSPWVTIVGVVGDVRTASLDRPPVPLVYLPYNSIVVQTRPDSPDGRMAAQQMPRVTNIVIRGAADPALLGRPARTVVQSLDPLLPVFGVTPMTAILAESTARTTFTGWMLAGGAAIALLLGIVGVYGVVAYTASMRVREIGLRLALGAEPAGIRRMMVRQSMAMVGLGLAGGLVLTLLITGSLQALLFGVSRNDPLTLGLVAAVLAGAAWLASWVPAVRAGRVDPTVTLAGE